MSNASAPVLINNTKNPARLIGFLGGAKRGGFTLMSGARHTLTAEQASKIADCRVQRAILAALIACGDVIDLHDTFGLSGEDAANANALPPAPAVPQPPRIKPPRKNETQPPAPIVTKPAQAETKIDVSAAPKNEGKPSTLVDLSEAEALAFVEAESDVDTLGAWFKADTRTNVRAAINARGAEVMAQKK